MGRKNYVYEDLLKEYTTLRGAELEKTAKAKTKIEEANAKIAANKSLMAKATESGDIDTYAELNAENAKNAEIVKFFTNVMETAKHNTSITPEQAHELHKKANEEVAAIREEYQREFVEALKPLIELSQKTYMQLGLLRIAKEKIETNLEHKQKSFNMDNFYNLSLMTRLNQILQDSDYKAYNPDFTEEQKRVGTYNNWKEKAETTIRKEAAKWI